MAAEGKAKDKEGAATAESNADEPANTLGAKVVKRLHINPNLLMLKVTLFLLYGGNIMFQIEPFYFVSLSVCLANAFSNFITVSEWNPPMIDNGVHVEEMQQILPRSLAVYGERLYLSLNQPATATLVSYPISYRRSTSILFPFPSMEMHAGKDEHHCKHFYEASGLAVDTEGSLWVLDNDWGSCGPRLFIFNLTNENELNSFYFLGTDAKESYLQAIAVDDSPSGWLAYIADAWRERIIVFSRNGNRYWSIKTPGHAFVSIALSPKAEPKRLFLGSDDNWNLYSIPVSELEWKARNTALKLKWIAVCSGRIYRLAFDDSNILYAAFVYRNYISACNISDPFREQQVYEGTSYQTIHPFTFTLDANGTLWLLENDVAMNDPPRLLKAADLLKSLK